MPGYLCQKKINHQVVEIAPARGGILEVRRAFRKKTGAEVRRKKVNSMRVSP
jgi:hypothetical protein